MAGYVYIVTNQRYGTLYVGVTNDIARRAHEHRHGMVGEFSRRYRTARLVWYEVHSTMPLAIEREKRLKRWKRRWKFDLIEAMNPDWNDLFDELNR
ncbi:GIY-YIG nuclease family protein [Microbaculum marinum]|uniref:GIY-YIG nuclease family protein n=1 Tax=Microbaculum marinum TaxID=1764581 RepID=A0AAW9RRG4_9HYPH